MDIFRQALRNFQNTAVFKNHLQEQILPLSKLEHMLSCTTSTFENCMYLKLTFFFIAV